MRKNNDKLRPANLKQTKSNNSKRAGSLIKVVFLIKIQDHWGLFLFFTIIIIIIIWYTCF